MVSLRRRRSRGGGNDEGFYGIFSHGGFLVSQLRELARERATSFQGFYVKVFAACMAFNIREREGELEEKEVEIQEYSFYLFYFIFKEKLTN